MEQKLEVPPSKRRTLFQLSADAEALQGLLEELEGDISDEAVAQALDLWLAENADAIADKADAYVSVIAEMQARSEVRKKESQRLVELARQDENHARRLKERLKEFMEGRGMTRLETPLHKLSVAQNGGKQALRVLVEPKDLPAEFQRVKVEADTEAIRLALELERPSVLPLAELVPRGTALRIR